MQLGKIFRWQDRIQDEIGRITNDTTAIKNQIVQDRSRNESKYDKLQSDLINLEKYLEVDKNKIESQGLMIRSLEDGLMKYEKRVGETLEMHEEHFDSKLYNLVLRRDNQDDRISELNLINQSIVEKA